MGIFTQSTSSNQVEDTIEAPVFEGYDYEVGGEMIALEESFDTRMNIVQAIHAMDSAEMEYNSKVATLKESAGEEEVDADELQAAEDELETVTEASMKNAWESIKKFFTNLWGKLRAFFDSVVRSLDALFKSGEAFAKKYESKAKALKLSGFKYEMYAYSNLDDYGVDVDVKGEAQKAFDSIAAINASVTNDNSEAIRSEVSKLRSYKEDALQKIRGEAVGTSSPLSADQYKKELHEYFRGGGSKSEVSVNLDHVLTVLKNTKAKAEALKVKKAIDTEFSDVIKKVNKMASEAGSSKVEEGGQTKTTRQAKVEATRVYGSIFAAQKSIILQAFRAWKDAWSERDRTYKACVLAAFRHKEPKADAGN